MTSPIDSHYPLDIAGRIGEIATRGMLFEVAVTPKPGMVDRCGSGVHQDMDYFTFMQSSAVLAQGFEVFAGIGLLWDDARPKIEMLEDLRASGQGYERRMLAATGGVNTHRGLLFLMGILAAAVGNTWRRTKKCEIGELQRTVQDICRGLVDDELRGKKSSELTVGQKAFSDCGLTGIRGELERGMPSLFNHGLPTLQAALQAGANTNDAGLDALMAIMTILEDTVVWKRGGTSALALAQQQAASVLSAGGARSIAGRRLLDKMCCNFVAQNLSAGGAADVLAATFSVYYWSHDLNC